VYFLNTGYGRGLGPPFYVPVLLAAFLAGQVGSARATAGASATEAPPSTEAVTEKTEAATDKAAAATALFRAPTDEPPHHVRRHYLWSNERRHDLFFADIKDLGGGYIGVGGDQNYTLAAAASAEVMWLIDLDAAVVHMHRLYAALVAGAPTSKDFLAYFDKHSTGAVHAAVAARYSDADEQREVLEIYHAYRDLLRDHLRGAAHLHRGRTWLSDPVKYQRIRELALHGRLLARLGDLTGPRTMLEIAEAAKRGGVVVRTIYLSNAESWFHYGPEFRRNITALPFDDKSVILRTVKSSVLGYPAGDFWHYTIQRSQHFADNLSRPAYRSIDVAMTDAVLGPSHSSGTSHIGYPLERGEKPLLAQAANPSASRHALISSGLVTRPEGNRERAAEMDRDRKRRAALELARSTIR
jgi:hypothetical protein